MSEDSARTTSDRTQHISDAQKIRYLKQENSDLLEMVRTLKADKDRLREEAGERRNHSQTYELELHRLRQLAAEHQLSEDDVTEVKVENINLREQLKQAESKYLQLVEDKMQFIASVCSAINSFNESDGKSRKTTLASAGSETGSTSDIQMPRLDDDMLEYVRKAKDMNIEMEIMSENHRVLQAKQKKLLEENKRLHAVIAQKNIELTHNYTEIAELRESSEVENSRRTNVQYLNTTKAPKWPEDDESVFPPSEPNSARRHIGFDASVSSEEASSTPDRPHRRNTMPRGAQAREKAAVARGKADAHANAPASRIPAPGKTSTQFTTENKPDEPETGNYLEAFRRQQKLRATHQQKPNKQYSSWQ